MKKLALIVAATAVILSACSVDHRDDSRIGTLTAPGEVQNEWTVLIYGAGNHVSDVLGAGQSEALEIAHGFQRIQASPQVYALALVGSYAEGGRCAMYDLNFNPSLTDQALQYSEIEDLGVRDLSSPEMLNHLVTYGADRHPARHYALAIVGQGLGWEGACRDDLHADVMTLPQLDQALGSPRTDGGSAIHLDVLLWLTPGMGCMEALYQLGDISDYVVSTSSRTAQPGFLATREWYLDLNLNPAMSGRELAEFAVSRMTEQALLAHDELAAFTLLNDSSRDDLGLAMDQLGLALGPYVSAHTGDLANLWSTLFDGRVEDASAVDILELADALTEHSVFGADQAVVAAAAELHAVFDAGVEQRGTWSGSGRGGITVYAPQVLDTAKLREYEAIQMTSEHRAWHALLEAMAQAGTSTLTLSGEASWPGHQIDRLYAFINVALAGVPEPRYVTRCTITPTDDPSRVSFSVTVGLNEESLDGSIYLFQDEDQSATISAGDQYGFYRIPPASRAAWVTVHRGESLDSLSIDLGRAY
jgi:hypothetical protein